MNLSVNWLNDYVDLGNIDIRELAEGLTMSGSKVEKYKSLSEPLDKIVIGKVTQIKKHENSDKLWICKVDVCLPEPIQIVTGAQNVFEGAVIPVVLDGGTVLNRQDGTALKIKKGKLRGEISNGMLCSPDELGLDKSDLPYADNDGILILNSDSEFDKIAIGMDALEFLGLKDTCVEFEITNNRPDCLSVTGLARETAVTFNLPLNLNPPSYKGYECNIEKEIDVVIENKRLCSRYMAGLATNVKIAPSPKWLASRLKASGVRPINNIVDITNYVMLEYGYPLHAFDRHFVEGGQISIRNARPGERITLLDGNTVELSEDTLVIADMMKPIAVAGVMGGEYSGVMPDTHTVIFEAACFDGLSVRMASKKIGRRTESSSRFEKGLDPANVKTALLRALQLVEELGCGEVSNTFIDYVNFTDEDIGVKHDYKYINSLLGTDIPEREQLDVFDKLGFKYKDGNVIPPKARGDIRLPCDLAEEIARIYGYNKIKPTLPRLNKSGNVSEYERNLRRLTAALTAQGCYECVTYSFVSSEMNQIADEVLPAEHEPVKIRNPFGEETGEMRLTLTSSMLRVIYDNINVRIGSSRFFEIGRNYYKDQSGVLHEDDVLCVGLFGEDDGFFALKGIIEQTAELFGAQIEFDRLADSSFCHPGRAATISTREDSSPVRGGYLGEISPNFLQGAGVTERVCVAEIFLKEFFKAANNKKIFKPIPKYPAVTRDLSLVCADETANGDIINIIKKQGGGLLEDIKFFDIFKGGNLKKDEKCLSYNMTFRKSGGTLTDGEVDKAVASILSALEKDGIKLRTA